MKSRWPATHSTKTGSDILSLEVHISFHVSRSLSSLPFSQGPIFCFSSKGDKMPMKCRIWKTSTVLRWKETWKKVPFWRLWRRRIWGEGTDTDVDKKLVMKFLTEFVWLRIRFSGKQSSNSTERRFRKCFPANFTGMQKRFNVYIKSGNWMG